LNNSKEGDAPLAQTIIQLIKNEKLQNVQQLVRLTKERTSATEKEIIEQVIRLQSQGKIKLDESPAPTPQKLSTYLKTKRASWYWITMILATTTAVTVFTVPEAYPIVYIRYILGTIFVIWLPGYSFIKALFPVKPPLKTSSESLDRLERLLLSICMSFVLVSILGLLLNFSPWGIRLTPVILSLLTLATVFATAGIIREGQRQMKEST